VLLFYSALNYCVEGISETTGASSDVYCQSNNDNHNGTSCPFYVESIKVKQRGELSREHRERERDIVDWGERERTELGRECGVGFISRTVILVLADSPKST
jgi:hypothetical protein